MTSTATVQLYLQSLAKVRQYLQALDDAAQELGRLTPNDSFVTELEDFTSKLILKANHANKRVYESGSLFFDEKSDKSYKFDVPISEGEEASQ